LIIKRGQFILPDQNVTSSQAARVFKIGATRIVEDAFMSSLDNEAVRSLLKATYPEIANATIREATTDDGQKVVEFLPQPGRKG
jgi:PRTRC genetic system protein C